VRHLSLTMTSVAGQKQEIVLQPPIGKQYDSRRVVGKGRQMVNRRYVY
jgi:hypothetical protein